MSAPSFSSFPPSFGSFPDLEPEEEKPSSSSKPSRKEEAREYRSDRSQHRHRSRGHESRSYKDRKDSEDRRKKEKHRHKEKTRHDDYEDDERTKREEDREAKLGTMYKSGVPGLFIVDKAGDPMNIVYGGLHAGDIPRYRRFGCECFGLVFVRSI